MITLTRLFAKQLRAVLRRALSLNSRDFGPPLVMEAGPEGLAFRAWTEQAAVEYRQPGSFPAEQLAVPLVLLADCEGTKETPVTIEAAAKGRLLCQWQEKQVPLMTRYDAQKPPKIEFPKPPAETLVYEPSLLTALGDAMETADEQGVRYALHCVQLHGQRGEIAGTDGRHLLVQSGFRFPWSDEVLIPRTTVFGSKELPHDVPIQVGRIDNWVSFAIGPWTIQLANFKEGRFPNLESYFRPRDEAVARLELSGGDATFLAENLKHLPCNSDDDSQGVTVDLNGAVAVRGRSPDAPCATELVLSNSHRFGEQIVFHTDRRYLARALALGFRELSVFSPDQPLLCVDERRKYAWAPLNPDGAEPSTGETLQIPSPPENGSSPQTSLSRKPAMMRRKKQAVSAADSSAAPAAEPSNGQVPPENPLASPVSAATSAESPPPVTSQLVEPSEPIGTAIEQAIALRESLRSVLAQTTNLVTALRREKKQARLVATTLASLRQLQAVP